MPGSSTIVAGGIIEVASNRQIVQHLTGGVVGEIRVKDGDVVKAGDVLMRLDDMFDRSELAVIEGQLFSLLGTAARLQAEQDEKAEITFDPELLKAATSDPEAAEIVAGQKRLMAARAETRGKQAAQLDEKKAQIAKQNEGLESRIKALEKTVRRTPENPFAGLRGTLIGGFCLVAGAIVAGFGGPMPLWIGLFVLGFLLAMRRGE